MLLNSCLHFLLGGRLSFWGFFISFQVSDIILKVSDLLNLILQVFYDTTGFLEKNRDTFREDLLHTLQESRFGTLSFAVAFFRFRQIGNVLGFWDNLVPLVMINLGCYCKLDLLIWKLRSVCKLQTFAVTYYNVSELIELRELSFVETIRESEFL